MNILLTGATGYIGSAVLPALLTSGHAVTALVRRDAVRRDGVTTVTGDMRDRDLVRRLAADADAVVATALPGDETSGDADNAFVDAVLEGLRPGRTLIRTGGVWVHGPGDAITEETPVDAPGLTAWRAAVDARALAAGGIRSVLIEPGIVHGHGRGIPALITGAAPAGDALPLPGPGTQHWTTVHVDDLADLYVAALERGEHGHRYLGVSGDNPAVREIGEAASRRRGLGGRVLPETPEALVARLGLFGEALLLDQQATGDKARRVLSWKPSRPSLLDEIAAGGYDPA
jgi:nucleoside-diphosphate-sugar epimerase